MVHFVYENWRAGPHKAIIHHAVCGFCNGGQGARDGTDLANGGWHGPYDSIAEAKQAQSQLDVQHRREHLCVST